MFASIGKMWQRHKHCSVLPGHYCLYWFFGFCSLLAAWGDGESRPDIAFVDYFLQLPNGNRVHYYDEGNPQGKTLLLVHRYPTSAYLYRYVIQELCGDEVAQFRCIAMTHVGFGQSSCPGNGSLVGPLYLADQLQLFIGEMKLDDIALDHPAGERRPGDIDSHALEDGFLPIKWQCIDILGGGHMGERAW